MNTIRAACEAAGWRYFAGSETLRAWCGEPDGIAHLPTVAGEANVSDSVYDSWVACYAENVAPGERARSRRRRKLRPATYADKLAIADACNLLAAAAKKLRAGGAIKAAAKTRRALKSAEGAHRHVQRRYHASCEAGNLLPGNLDSDPTLDMTDEEKARV